MKIIATSDIHGNFPKAEDIECDVFVLAGDICPIHNHYTSFQCKWLMTDFVRWLELVKAKHILIVGGNHDFALESNDYDKFKEEIIASWPSNVTYLEDSGVTIDGVSFWGTPWTGNLPNWAFQAEGDAALEKFDKIPSQVDVLVSHGPPEGYGDRTSTTHAGDPNLLYAIEYKEPSVIICGHIHEGYGYYRVPHLKTEIYSVSYLKRDYVRTNPLVEIDI
jgi:Icc-related predicted phosphoesterase